jgi:hypothetical protein
MKNKVLELSWNRKKEIERNWEGRDIPYDLINQCAYFPREPYWVFGKKIQPCEECSFSQPNEKCSRAHILVDTRIEGVSVKCKVKRKKKSGLSRLLDQMKEEDRMNVEEYLKGKGVIL